MTKILPVFSDFEVMLPNCWPSIPLPPSTSFRNLTLPVCTLLKSTVFWVREASKALSLFLFSHLSYIFPRSHSWHRNRIFHDQLSVFCLKCLSLSAGLIFIKEKHFLWNPLESFFCNPLGCEGRKKMIYSFNILTLSRCTDHKLNFTVYFCNVVCVCCFYASVSELCVYVCPCLSELVAFASVYNWRNISFVFLVWNWYRARERWDRNIKRSKHTNLAHLYIQIISLKTSSAARLSSWNARWTYDVIVSTTWTTFCHSLNIKSD